MPSRAARPDYFRCPFCSTVSHNAYDLEHGYCAWCKVFVPDVITAAPQVRQIMADLYRRDADRHVDRSEQLRRTAAAWLFPNAVTGVDPADLERG